MMAALMILNVNFALRLPSSSLSRSSGRASAVGGPHGEAAERSRPPREPGWPQRAVEHVAQGVANQIPEQRPRQMKDSTCC